MERLQKLISAAGLCSRRRAEEWITQGKVTVNGGLAHLGDRADPAVDEIRVEGALLPPPAAASTTVLLYKPRGYVTTLSDEKGRPTVAELLPHELGRLYPVGRLDQFSEGLLLLTNDGELSQRLTHPKGEVEKTYHLWVSGYTPGADALLRRPIVLDGRKISPPAVRLLWQRGATGTVCPRCASEAGVPQSPCRVQKSASPGKEPQKGTDPSTSPRAAQDDRTETGSRASATALLEITIHEGRNRQIRRMAQAAGLTPTRLKRIAEGPITLGELKPGQWRRLTEAELEELRCEN